MDTTPMTITSTAGSTVEFPCVVNNVGTSQVITDGNIFISIDLLLDYDQIKI